MKMMMKLSIKIEMKVTKQVWMKILHNDCYGAVSNLYGDFFILFLPENANTFDAGLLGLMVFASSHGLAIVETAM